MSNYPNIFQNLDRLDAAAHKQAAQIESAIENQGAALRSLADSGVMGNKAKTIAYLDAVEAVERHKAKVNLTVATLLRDGVTALIASGVRQEVLERAEAELVELVALNATLTAAESEVKIDTQGFEVLPDQTEGFDDRVGAARVLH